MSILGRKEAETAVWNHEIPMPVSRDLLVEILGVFAPITYGGENEVIFEATKQGVALMEAILADPHAYTLAFGRGRSEPGWNHLWWSSYSLIPEAIKKAAHHSRSKHASVAPGESKLVVDYPTESRLENFTSK